MTNIFSHFYEKRKEQHAANALPHLQRFASPAQYPAVEEPSTICGDILHAAHVEVERLETVKIAPASTLEATLGLISYCYTKGLFSSLEIEHILWETPAFIKTFGDNLPTAQQIRSFRRRNRALILSVIEQAIAEFLRREPISLFQQVVAVESTLATSAEAMAEWLLNMANFSDAIDSADD
jgi:hypothetical protein